MLFGSFPGEWTVAETSGYVCVVRKILHVGADFTVDMSKTVYSVTVRVL